MSMLLSSVLALAGLNAVPDHMDVQLPSGPHPCVFLTTEEREAVHERRQAHEWAANVASKLLREAESLVEAPLDILHAEGQWSHWYTCEKDGARLRAETPKRHVCSKCNTVYTGFPYDEVYVTYQHNRWFGGLETLGMAYALEPKPAYAERARAILLEYASFYEDLELHDKNGKDSRSGGRLYAQTLNEAVSLCRLALGYDLLYEADCFTDADHETIADDLIRPMVDTILNYKAGMSNWQSWHNGAIASAGFLLRDKAMVDFAINDPKHGFLFQMRKSVLPSGMWYEGAPSYHWYALSAHVYLLEAAQRAGMDLYGLPVVRSLFDGPTKPLFPDMTYPAINDSSRSSIKSATRYYEIAYRRYGDPNFLALREPRNTEYGLFWGKEAPEGTNAPELTLESSNDREGGLAILRDNARDIALFFNYNPVTSGHVHPAKLDIILYAHGDERIVDPGRLPYGNPLHRGWYTTTLAHNTVVVDGKTQARAPGKFDAFETDEAGGMVRATLNEAYEGVQMERTLLLKNGVIFDVFVVLSDEDHTYDLPLHFNGTLEGVPDGAPDSLGSSHGYDHLKDVMKLDAPLKEFRVDTGDGSAIHVHTPDLSDTYTATGRAQPATKYIPLVLRRQKGKTAQFVTVYQILESGEQPEEPLMMMDNATLSVQVGETRLSTDSDLQTQLLHRRITVERLE